MSAILVDADDVAPAGRPDECFWCRRKMGEEHGPECVRVVVDVVYSVAFRGEVVGTWALDKRARRHLPASLPYPKFTSAPVRSAA